ncbi:TetR family transcriptional regulator [Streptomyces sp. NPDC048290]|uniref:TetR family transcriptional regulator n=1 Tax=Streptomyces sp. NPDC048290 TaxID=3155811 RepID=UPI003443459D
MSDKAQGLRERKRLKTALLISDTSLELFEKQGTAGTTVDEIADAVGISQRTFFRYFPRKEDAVFWNSFWSTDHLTHLVDHAALDIRAGTDPVAALHHHWTRTFTEFIGDDTALHRFLRLNRLIHTDPALLTAALERNQAFVRHAGDRLGADLAPALPAWAARTAVALVSSVFRVTLDEVARRERIDAPADIAAVHGNVVGVLRSARIALEPGVRGPQPQGACAPAGPALDQGLG